jgi:hypothetical protein
MPPCETIIGCVDLKPSNADEESHCLVPEEVSSTSGSMIGGGENALEEAEGAHSCRDVEGVVGCQVCG